MNDSLPNRHPIGTRPYHLPRDASVFVILLALYVLVLLPILRANRYYNDDLKRALIGHTGWDSTGRPLTTLLMKLLQCYDHALVDISPLTQIGAIAILAWIGVLIARRYAIASPWLAALVSFPLGAQPFYLENLSYKFDALSMSLAIYFALLPLIALKSSRRGWWLGVLALFVSLNFYQPAINAYLIFTLLDLVIAQLQEKKPRQLAMQLCSRALQVSLSMLIYQFAIGIHIHGWVKRKSEKIHDLHDLPQIKTNIVNFYHFIGDSFNTQWWLYFAPALLLLALFPLAVGIHYAAKVQRAQPASIRTALFTSSALLPLAALACVLGPMLLLLDPVIAPRVLMGVGALLVAGLIVMQAALLQWRQSDKWTLSIAGMLALGMCSFANAYGNALGEQKNYEDRIATRLADDLAEFATSHPIH
ncbi:glucosyltransferase domain-containing protein, partial [Dyella silvatica]|uniref:glucosyltransferase domain-containing protein n=1 Tax=Dyella silvatica TaxID=2992128 RepID=UPI002258CE41